MGTLFDPKFVMVFDPEVVKQVFRGPHEQLRAGEANAPLGPVLGARSVLLLDGDEHLRQRRLMLPSFHGERMREYETVMTDGGRPGDRLVAGRRDLHAAADDAVADARRDHARRLRRRGRARARRS